MVVDILIGAIAMWAIMFLIDYAKRENFKLEWWHWVLTVLNVIYFVFVVEVFYGFLHEGAGQAAIIMGILVAFFGIIWAVLLARFVFVPKPATPATK